MRILVTGACGFAGSALCRALLLRRENLSITGVDNFLRPGSELNRPVLTALGVRVIHADVRMASDWAALPPADWVIDAAANPSVLAGLEGQGSPRQLFEHNLWGGIEALEYCRQYGAGLILLSSSRVYSVAALASLPLQVRCDGFALEPSAPLPPGVSPDGIAPDFSTSPPVSLYGASKLALELLAQEYAAAFQFPVWIDRCGVLAGAGQFGTPDQGIFSFWIHAHARRRPLRYFGFGGSGYQVRDALHPADLAALVAAQMSCSRAGGQRIYTAGGGPANSISLRRLTAWCDDRFGPQLVAADGRERPFDVPWAVMDSGDAARDFHWRPAIPLEPLLSEIAAHAEAHPNWLEVSGWTC